MQKGLYIVAVRAQSFSSGLLKSEGSQVCSSEQCDPSGGAVIASGWGGQRCRGLDRAGHGVPLTIDRNFAPVDCAESQEALHVFL